jgi:hypothetical protein
VSDFLTKKEFEAWQKNQKSPNKILSHLLLAQGGNFMVPLIIFGTFTGTSATITFTKPFKAGTVPVVVGRSQYNACYVVVPSVSATQATIRSISSLTQALASSPVAWVAIGESS